MAGSKAERIADLLRRGLDLYGEGCAEEAEACWNEVLSLDPGNAEARDYLDAHGAGGDPFAVSDRESRPRPERGPGRDPLAGAVQRMRAGDLESALEMFEKAAQRGGDASEALGYLEMVRSKLLERYRERMGGLGAVPTVCLPQGRLLDLDLPPSTGFLLSLVDGSTTVNELISLSGFDSFEALRALHGLVESGVVECAP